MGINAKQWGSQAWHFIHSVAYTYPENPTESEKDNYLAFINSLSKVLPCSICSEHFMQILQYMPPKLDSQQDFFNWSIDVHNEVNKSNGKPILSYEDALNQFYLNSVKNLEVDEDSRLFSIKAKHILNNIKKLKT